MDEWGIDVSVLSVNQVLVVRRRSRSRREDPIFDGMLDRFPKLKICGAHGGGYLPSYFGRTEVACNGGGATDCANQKPPREYLRTQIINATFLNNSDKEAILGGNLIRMLRLDRRIT